MEEYFGIPEGYQARLVMAVGYPAKVEPPRKKIRKPFEEACSFNRW
jgi:nitroreductase